MFLFLAVMTLSNPATVNAAAIAVPIVVVASFFIVVIVIILLVYVVHHRRRSKSVSMSVSDKPLPVRNDNYAPAESTVTNTDSGVKDKRDSTFKEVEFPDQCYAEDSGRNSEDHFI